LTYSISNVRLNRRGCIRDAKIAVLLVTLWLSIFGCSGYTTIAGRYLSDASRDVSDVRVQFSLNDLDGKEFNYFVRLRPDGSFRFKVRYTGKYLLSTGISEYSRKKWRSPSLSNDSNVFPIWIPKSGTLHLETNYISDVIRIISPFYGQVISLSSNFEVTWEANSLAQYYSLSLYGWKESGEPRPVITVFNIQHASFNLSDIHRIEKVVGELAFESIQKKGMFIRQGSDVIPGSYGLSIRAYNAVHAEKRFVNVARSPDEWRLTLSD